MEIFVINCMMGCVGWKELAFETLLECSCSLAAWSSSLLIGSKTVLECSSSLVLFRIPACACKAASKSSTNSELVVYVGSEHAYM